MYNTVSNIIRDNNNDSKDSNDNDDDNDNNNGNNRGGDRKSGHEDVVGFDIVLIDKKNQETFIIDVAIPGDFRVREKEAEKKSKYQDLALEISRM